MTTLAELTLIETFFYIIIGWTIIALWQRLAENTAYNGIGFNRESPYHNFIVALVSTMIFFLMMVVIPRFASTFDFNPIAAVGDGAFDPGVDNDKVGPKKSSTLSKQDEHTSQSRSRRKRQKTSSRDFIRDRSKRRKESQTIASDDKVKRDGEGEASKDLSGHASQSNVKRFFSQNIHDSDGFYQ